MRDVRSATVGGVILSYLALTLLFIFAIYPIARVITITMRPGEQLPASLLTSMPAGDTFADFRTLITEPSFRHWLLHSSGVALAVTLPGVALASAIAYALSRQRRLGRSSMLHGLLVTQLLPAIILLLLLSLLMLEFKLLSVYFAVVILYATTALPFCIWQLKSYYDTIPLSVEEAAAIDGCSRWQSFPRILLPVVTPALLMAGFFSFIVSWNEYVLAAFVFQDGATPSFTSRQFTETMAWELYAAGALLVALPVFFIFLFFGRYLLSGLSSGAAQR